MAWTIEWDKRAVKELTKIDKFNQSVILSYLKEVVASSSVRAHGKPLKGKLKGLWRYRVGNHRVICQIEDNRCVVFVVRVAHRKHVYESIDKN